MPYRQSLWRTEIWIDTIGNLGAAAKWEGAGADSDTSEYQTATGGVQLGGTGTREDGTATYLYTEELHAVWKAIETAKLHQRKARITRTPVADDGTPFAGGGFTMTARLKGCKQPDTDHGSNDGAEATLTFSVDTALA